MIPKDVPYGIDNNKVSKPSSGGGAPKEVSPEPSVAQASPAAPEPPASPAGNKGQEQTAPAEAQQEEEAKTSGEKPSLSVEKQTVNQETSSSTVTQPHATEDWFLRAEGEAKHKHVHFPMRPGVEVIPLVCGQKFFKEFANSIASAERSVDIITWGLDTDMVLVRSGGQEDYALTSAYPHETYCHHTKGACAATTSACPYKDKEINPLGLRISDLLACVARRGVKVRILVWEPQYFAKNVIDPCHYWFRCKTKLIPNTQFAFRKFDGVYTSEKPPAPKVMVKKTGVWNWVGKQYDDFMGNSSNDLEEYQNGLLRAQEEKLKKLLSESTDGSHKAAYNFIYTHHQKMALIDIDKGPNFDINKAVGFIMGFNLKEEYWDDTQHEEISSMRLSRKREGKPGPSLGPWQDVGAKLRGSILFDMAQNMAQRWEIEDEVLPAGFISGGLATLTSNEAANTKWDNASFIRIRNTLEKVKPMPVSFWQHNFQQWALAVCAYLTGLLELIEATLSNKFEVSDLIKNEEGWSGNPESADKYAPKKEEKTPEDWYKQTAQYLRTFSLSKPPLDLSIATAELNVINKVQAGGLLYYENQYFRDPNLGQEIVNLYKNRSNGLPGQSPYTIIVTNRQTNDRGQAVNPEALVAAKPTKMVYEQLNAGPGAGNIVWCWLHVGKRDTLNPDSPREAHLGENLVTAIVQFRKDWGDEKLLKQHAKIKRWRNRIYYWLTNEYVVTAGKGTAKLLGLMDSVTQWISAIGVPVNIFASDVFLDVRNFVVARLLEVSGPAYQGAQKLPDLTMPDLETSSRKLPEMSRKKAAETLDVPEESIPTNAWEMLERILDKIPDPPDQKGEDLDAPADAIAKWFETEFKKMDGLAEEEKPDAQIKQLEDQRGILEGLFKRAETPTEIAYVLGQMGVNEMMMWKEQRLKAKEDAESKAVKGAIYVHSKVLIVDEVLAMIGSNNINERSMYHDSENAVMFGATDGQSMAAELRKQLFNIMVGEGMNDFSSDFIFSKFQEVANANSASLETGGLKGHVVTYVPDETAFGSPVLS